MQPTTPAPRTIPGLDRKRAFLASGAAWPDAPPPRVIETHSALVFVGATRVLKMKKPVRLPHNDLTTLAARHHACREELRLNLALAGDVYRRVVPLVLGEAGALACDGEGLVVDWMVEMKRLPEAEFLDYRLRAGPPVRAAELARAVARLVRFYHETPRPVEAGPRYLDRWVREGRINAAHLAASPTLARAYDPRLGRAALGLITRHRAEIFERGRAGLLLDGHGDLRPEHVCIGPPPVLFDRLEFDPRLRLVDPAEELFYLGLEARALGAEWIGPAALDWLAAAGVLLPSRGLLVAYGINRCLTRARLAIDHLRDPSPATPQAWPAQARRYIALAEDMMSEVENG